MQGGNMRRALVGMAIIAVPVISMALPARADGGPSGFFATQTPTVDCHSMSIDPPSDPNTWPVTFHGTINDKPFSKTVDFFSEEGNTATVDTTDLMAPSGPLHVVLTVDSPEWGTSPTVATTITCHDVPVTPRTVTVAPETAVLVTSTVTASTATTVTSSTPVSAVLGESITLPRTGSSSSVPLGAIGFGAALVGSVALILGRRRLTRHGLRGT